jgi:hypothetical protein
MDEVKLLIVTDNEQNCLVLGTFFGFWCREWTSTSPDAISDDFHFTYAAHIAAHKLVLMLDCHAPFSRYRQLIGYFQAQCPSVPLILALPDNPNLADLKNSLPYCLNKPVSVGDIEPLWQRVMAQLQTAASSGQGSVP